MLSVFPAGGAPSPVLTTCYQKPRVLYLAQWFVWTMVSMGRYALWAVNIEILLIWGCVDALLLFGVTIYLTINNGIWQHHGRWLGKKPHGDVDAAMITHCLAVLHYKEPDSQLYELVDELAKQESEGKKVLLVGMERGTPDQEQKIKEIEQNSKGAFSKIIYTVHDLRKGEIPGTGSNHFEAQVAAELYFEDKTNVIFSKFDCNMKLSGPLLREIEAVWCHVDPSKRLGITFMPNVCWSADCADIKRSFMEKFVAFMMSVSSNMAPFSMAFVSGSLQGALQVGYTPPALLSEDELMFTKKMCLLPKASTYRLSSYIMKVFYPNDCSNIIFGGKVFLPKLERWFVGWIEVHAYLGTWLFCGVRDHPRITHPIRASGVLFLTLLRMYSAFVLPISAIVMPFVYHICWQRVFLPPNTPEGAPSWWLPLLVCQAIISGISGLLSLFQMVRIQYRLYRSFDCLKFHWTTVPMIIIGTPLIMVFPLRLLWTYFKHGMLNAPVVHTANTDGLDKVVISSSADGSFRSVVASLGSEMNHEEAENIVVTFDHMSAMAGSYNVDIGELDDLRQAAQIVKSFRRRPTTTQSATFHGTSSRDSLGLDLQATRLVQPNSF